MMTSWATIIYGRTYELDFNLLAVPENFTEDDRNWALKHIQILTKYPEDLHQKLHWGTFSKENVCILGFSCYLEDLIKKTNLGYLQESKDKCNRPLYAFIGFVSNLKLEDTLNYPGFSDLDNFTNAYSDYISQIFYYKSYEASSRIPVLTPYQPKKFSSNEKQQSPIPTFPDTTHQSVVEVVVQDISTGQELSRKSEPVDLDKNEANPKEDNENNKLENKKSENNQGRLIRLSAMGVGALGGLLIGFLVTSSLNQFVLYVAGIGAVSCWLVTGLVLKVVNNKNSYPHKKLEKPINRVNNSMMGFKAKDEKK